MSDSPHVVVIPVEGIGPFTFRRRNMRAEIAAKVERERLSEGIQLDGFMTMFIDAVADLKTLIIPEDSPKGWAPEDIDNLDPFDDASYGKVLKVWSALRDKEETFRAARKAGADTGAGAGGHV